MDRDEKGKPLTRPKVFDIDLSVCMQCGICVEVCPFESIKMDCDFEYAKYDRFEPFVARLSDLLKPNEYYQKIKPNEAAVVDAKLKADAEKKAAKKAASAVAPKPVAPPSAKLPSDVLTDVEKAAWLKAYQEPLGIGPITWPPVPAAKKAASPVVAATTPVETSAAAGGDWPWHDQSLDLKQRLELARDRSLADKLMAAMAQTDCHACGYDCRGYADAIAAGGNADLTLCVPGEEETTAMLEKLLKEAGKT
jgi:Na+-translocating ferredoxin:NAD+ oxidoreductase RNF subunit RnfB